MAAIASYYDTIGLLAICDAIESVEGVKIANFAVPLNHGHNSPIISKGPPYPAVPSVHNGFNRQTATTPAHGFLSHAPAYLSGDNGPSIQPPQGGPNGHYPVPAPGAPGHDFPNLPPNLLPRQATAQGVLLGRGDNTYGSAAAAVLPVHGGVSPVPHVNSSPRVAVPPHQPQPQVPRITPPQHQSMSPQQPPRNQNYRQSAAAGSKAYKREQCPICNRIFEGPKASTHKQQHIRRLHPQDYMPKRGGKKRVIIDPVTGQPTTLMPGQMLPESPQPMSPQPGAYGSPGMGDISQ